MKNLSNSRVSSQKSQRIEENKKGTIDVEEAVRKVITEELQKDYEYV